MKDSLTSTVVQCIIAGMKQARELDLPPCFAYDRISDEAQSGGVSLESQEYGSTQYAARKKFHIVHHFEVIESASKGDRRVFKQMMELALQFDVKHLIFKNTDRMSRNYEEWLQLDKLIYSNDITIHFYQTGRIISKHADFSDRFLIHIELAVANQLSDKISQDVREANKHKANRGIAPFTTAPFGYIYNRKDKHYEIDPGNRHTLDFIFDEYDTGRYSLNQFIDLLENKGIKTPTGRERWSKSQLHHLLSNPFYHGQFYLRKQDTVMQGNHEPYYGIDRYEARVSRLGHRFVGRKNRNFEFHLAGFMRCQCGRVMTGSQLYIKQAGGTMQPSIIYAHKCLDKPNAKTGKPGGQVMIYESRIFEILQETVREARFSETFAENLKNLFRDHINRKTENHAQERAFFTRKIQAVYVKKDRLLTALSEGVIEDLAAINKKLMELNREIQRLEQQRGALEVGNDQVMLTIAEIIDKLRDMPLIFLEAPVEGKMEILKVMASGVILNGEHVEIQWREPFSFLMKDEILQLKETLTEDYLKELEVRTSLTMLPQSYKLRTSIGVITSGALDYTIHIVKYWIAA
jgi:site-specific DNA recombinase